MTNSLPVDVSTEPTGALLTPLAETAPKKKRNLPGMPDPDAEVIALSPTTLMATNRFVCEICSKGFQRDQNLQLHRRGHNLPWKLKQRTGKEPPRKRVFVCPEPSCVHHSPARALGDLTGIKKHFSRKHGEKKWKCERCTKKYAVQSDWKAHMKVCGTKEYKCDCGTLFSRRDSFFTHRAFCEALADETSREQPQTNPVVQTSERYVIPAIRNVASPPPPPQTPSTTVVSPVLSIQSSDLPENVADVIPAPAPAADPSMGHTGNSFSGSALPPPPPSRASPSTLSGLLSPSATSDRLGGGGGSLPSPSAEPSASLSLFLSSTATSIFSRTPEQNRLRYLPVTQPPPPAMSATALLQKAAQMGSTASNSSSLLRGLGLAMSSSLETTPPATTTSAPSDWSRLAKPEPYDSVGYGLGLGLAPLESPILMCHPPSLFGPTPTTLDFLGLGGPRSGLSALLTSLEGGFGADPPPSYGDGSGGGTWNGNGDRNGPSFL